jgi:hypothetical protein
MWVKLAAAEIDHTTNRATVENTRIAQSAEPLETGRYPTTSTAAITTTADVAFAGAALGRPFDHNAAGRGAVGEP